MTVTKENPQQKYDAEQEVCYHDRVYSYLRVYFYFFLLFPKLNCFWLPFHLENNCFFQN